MKSDTLVGKIFFFKTDKSNNPKDCFTPLLEVNSNFDNLKSINLTNGKAYGITINNELLEWEFEKKKTAKKNSTENTKDNNENLQSYTQSMLPNKKNDFYFLLTKPSYRFHKMKIKSIALNKTMCLSLDINGNVLVWGQSKDGLLGLGYEVNKVDNPTILDGLVDIVDISLSDYHAVALNSSGTPFSWGLGKYGELGLERSIYSPVPQQMNSETLYSRVFCGNLITCFLDFEGHFSYFGVIIRQLGGNSSTVTTKNLLNDQNIDSKSIFLEKEFEELEDQKFKEIVIGNGFIGLLSKTGTLFTLEYNDKLTMLYSKYYLYNIVVAKNEIFGLAKDSMKITENKNNINNNQNNLINSVNEEKIKTNYYLCRWSSKSSSENEVCSDIWITTIWKFKDEFTNVIENGKLLDTNDNRNILLLLDSDEKYSNNLNTSVLNPNKKFLDLSSNNEFSMLDVSVNNTTIADNIMMFNMNKKKLPNKILEYEAEFDDSYNLKYKRTKAKSKSILKDLPYIGTIRSRSMSKILNKSYNASFQNSAYNLNKSNFANFGNNNISAIGLGPNTSAFVVKKNYLIPTSTNYKKTSGRIFQNKLNNYNNLSGQNNSSKNKNNNFTQNTKSSFSANNNDNSKDNNDIDNNFNSSNKKEKDNDQVNIYEESIDAKERELNKYRSEIDNIIANYKSKQNINKTNLLNKYGLSHENNINIKSQKNQGNNMNNITDQKDKITNINIKDQIENSKNGNNFDNDNINLDEESPFKKDFNKRYELENELNNNILRISIKGKDISKNEKEKMKIIKNYFQIEKVNPKKRMKRGDAKENKSENEIDIDLNREETFRDINNNNSKENNSLIINNPFNLFIRNSELSGLNPTKFKSEGTEIINNENEENYNYNNNIVENNNNINIIPLDKNGKNVNYNNELISSPAFYNGDLNINRLSDLIINETNKNKNSQKNNFEIKLKDNNNNKEIKNTKNMNPKTKNNNFVKNSRFTFGANQNIKIISGKKNNLKDERTELTNDDFVIENINNINLNYDQKYGNMNNEVDIDSNKKSNKNNKEGKNNDFTKNIPKSINLKKFDNKGENTNYNNIKTYQSQKNTTKNDNNNKVPSNLNKNNNNINFISSNNSGANSNKFNTKNKEDKNKKSNIKIENPDEVFANNNNENKRQIPYSNTSKENNSKNNFNNNENESTQNNRKNSKIAYKKENIYSYNTGINDKRNNIDNYNIENLKNNLIYQNSDENKSNISPYLKSSSLAYFCHVLKDYMRKKCYLMCAYEIANFQKRYEKNLSLKLLFMTIKKRIIFYKIKFFHRYKKIYRYMVKYKKTNNMLSKENNQKQKQYNIKKNK